MLRLPQLALAFSIGHQALDLSSWGLVQQPSEVYTGQSRVQVQLALWPMRLVSLFVQVGEKHETSSHLQLESSDFYVSLLSPVTNFSGLWRLKKAYKQAMSKWEDDYECARVEGRFWCLLVATLDTIHRSSPQKLGLCFFFLLFPAQGSVSMDLIRGPLCITNFSES